MTDGGERPESAGDSMNELAASVRAFAAERGWERFHSPKNLSMAIVAEAAELLEIFQWKTEEESRGLEKEALDHVRSEIADVAVFLLNLCNMLNISLADAVREKIALNARRYPPTQDWSGPWKDRR